MKNVRAFLSENFQLLEVKFSIYLNRRVFVMYPFFLLADSDGPDQTARMRRLIWAFAVRIYSKTLFVVQLN